MKMCIYFLVAIFLVGCFSDQQAVLVDVFNPQIERWMKNTSADGQKYIGLSSEIVEKQNCAQTRCEYKVLYTYELVGYNRGVDSILFIFNYDTRYSEPYLLNVKLKSKKKLNDEITPSFNRTPPPRTK